MSSFDEDLNQRLDAIRSHGLYRELRRIDSPQGREIRISGQPFLNFSSNDYLGLANDPLLKEAAANAVAKFGVGSGASRLICGSLAPYHELEESLAAWKGTGAALTFSTGYATAVGTICALLEKDDVIILDKLVHACIVDAARLCGAKLRVFAHNDLEDLEKILRWAREQRVGNPHCRILVVTESIFSMDGDVAPLKAIVALKNQFDAWLMVDEAHATGVYGAKRSGVAEQENISSQIEIQMGTLGKALGSSGGYICGSRPLIDFLVNRARSFIFSTAPVPAGAAAATAAIQFVQSAAGGERRDTLFKRISQFSDTIKRPREQPAAIVPLIVGDEKKAVEAATKLREKNLFVPAIRFPTVARGQARLRVTLTAAHTETDVSKLLNALEELKLEFQN